jgi:hypothetical protein
MDRILILDGENPLSLPFLSFYHKLKYRVFVGSPHRFPIAAFSKVPCLRYRHPPSGYLTAYGKSHLVRKNLLSAFIRSLQRFLRRYSIERVIPLSEFTMVPILFHLNELPIENIYPPYPTIEKLHDKSLLLQLIKEIRHKSFLLPATYFPNHLRFPCVVRPTKGTGSRHVYLCKNRKEFERALFILKMYGRDLLVQEYIRAEKRFAINLLINKKGKVVRCLSSLPLRRARILRIVKDLERFFKLIGYFGFASPQFIVENKKVYLTEINPRLSFYFYGLDFGVDFPQGFHELFIERRDAKRITKFIERFPSFGRASALYLKQRKDPLPVLKQFKDFIQAKLLRMLIAHKTHASTIRQM